MTAWTAESLPPELVTILDEQAGRVHSPGGAVRRCLADILNEYDRLRAEPTEWGGPEPQWTLGVRRPDGTCWVEPHLAPEADVRKRFEEMIDTGGYRKALLRREVGPWVTVEEAREAEPE